MEKIEQGNKKFKRERMLGKWVGVFKMEGCDHVRNYVFF